MECAQTKKRYSQSDMQIKHYLCSVNKTLPKFQRVLSPRHMQAESPCWQFGWGLLPLVSPRAWKLNTAATCPVQSQGRSWLWILLQSFCHLSYLTSDKCQLRKAEQRMQRYPHHYYHHYPNLHATTSHLPSSAPPNNPELGRAEKKPRDALQETTQLFYLCHIIVAAWKRKCHSG